MMFVQTEQLTVTYLDDEKPVLQNVSLQIGPEERVLLLGPSGAGKSTLLHAFSGLVPRAIEAHVEGNVFVDGKPVTQWSPAEVATRLGFVFQEPDTQFCMLYPTDEVAFGLENLKENPDAMSAVIDNSFSQVNLPGDARQKRIDLLSGGQQQRLALASVLAQNPTMLLLDEPTALLDPGGRRQVVDTVYSVVSRGKGVIVVEHLLDPWLDLLGRVIVIDHSGRVVADDIPSIVFNKKRSLLHELGVWIPRNPDQSDPQSSTRSKFSSPIGAFPKKVSVGKPEPVDNGRALAPVLSLTNVTAGYREGEHVLRDINLRVQKGEFWALIGPNGSGKSTLAKLLIRMLVAKEGRVKLGTHDVSQMPTKQLTRNVAYVFQNPEHQFVTDTVWSEINYSLKQAGVPDSKRAERIRTTLIEFGLENHMENNPFALSGGQKRRLAVAAMLQANAPLLVLDEPTFGQDRHHAHQLMKTISQLHSSGIAVLMLTHDMDLVDEYAEKVAVMHDGKIVYSGAVEELWSHRERLVNWDLELPTKMNSRRSGSIRNEVPAHVDPY